MPPDGDVAKSGLPALFDPNEGKTGLVLPGAPTPAYTAEQYLKTFEITA